MAFLVQKKAKKNPKLLMLNLLTTTKIQVLLSPQLQLKEKTETLKYIMFSTPLLLQY